MTINKIEYLDEFWGAKIWDEEVSIEEEYDGEVYDYIVELLEKGWDEIPETLEVDEEGNLTDRCGKYEIYTKDYLTNEQLRKLEDLLEKYLKEEEDE